MSQAIRRPEKALSFRVFKFRAQQNDEKLWLKWDYAKDEVDNKGPFLQWPFLDQNNQELFWAAVEWSKKPALPKY